MIVNKEQLLEGKEFREERERALSFIEEGLEAADAGKAVGQNLDFDGKAFVVHGERIELPEEGKLFVAGAGKAGRAMASALNEIAGGRIDAGLVISTSAGREGRIEIAEGTHPLPSKRNVEFTERIVELVEGAGEKDLVVALVSGGGSALLCSPGEGISLEDLKAANKLLLSSKADIREINCVRKHLSRVKGGRLAEKAFPARVLALVVSDVVGDDLEAIASGPTVADSSTFKDALEVLGKHGLLEKVPESVRRALEQGAQGKKKETPKKLEGVSNVVVLGKEQAVEAMGRKAGELGLKAVFLGNEVEGKAGDAGIELVKRAVEERRKAGERIALVVGGETTVEVKGPGVGGRNQEAVLASLGELEKAGKAVFVSVNSDGKDGNSEAAGAVGDSNSLRRAKELGLEAQEFLRNNDSFHFFEKLGDAIITGETGTNVADLCVVVVD